MSERHSLPLLVGAAVAFAVLVFPNISASAAIAKLSSPHELVNPDPAATDSFGYSVSTAAKTAAVGADNEGLQGTVFIFGENGSRWAETAKLTPADPDARYFGFSVALSQNLLVVGSPFGDDAGNGESWIFQYSGSTWTQVANLTGSGQYGSSVATNGNVVAVGGDDQVDIYTDVNSTWTLTQTLQSPSDQENDGFGSYNTALGIDADNLIVGAPDAGPGKTYQGRAYIYDWTNGSYQLATSLTDPGTTRHSMFGYGVAISGESAVVGAPWKDNYSGAAYIFRLHSGNWIPRLSIPDPRHTSRDGFGQSVAAYGNAVVIGAPGASRNDGESFVYGRRTGGIWSETAALSDPQSRPANYGSATAVGADAIIIGGCNLDNSSGEAYAYDRN